MSGQTAILSFRLKIALLAGVIAGTIVIGSGIVLWLVTYQFSLDGVDQNIRNLGQANLQRLVGPSHWVRLQDSLSVVAGEQNPPSYRIWVETSGRVDYRSPEWPSEVDPRGFRDSWEKRSQVPAVPRPPFRREPISESNKALVQEEGVFFSQRIDGSNWRIGVMGNFFTTLAVAVNLDSFDSRMNGLGNRYFAVFLFALLLAGSGAWLIAQRSLRPVEALSLAVKNVSEKGLDQRIEGHSYDREFLRLVTMFNEMMDRLEKAFHQSRRFSADASHELKTPLSRLQMELEHALSEARSESKEQAVYSSLLDEVARLSSIVEKLTLLTASDLGKLKLSREQIDLSGMLENVSEDCKAMAEGRSVEVVIEENVHVSGDSVLLEQALQNLSRNALKYGRAGGRIKFCLRTDVDGVWILVANEGEPIGADDREKIFERFYQTDLSRTAQKGGVGLGLSLSREIVRAHDGELRLKRSDEQWTIFEIRL